MVKDNYEHSGDLHSAQNDLASLRKRVRKLWWISGGRGYDNMGRRELEQVRLKLDEADHWLAQASRSLNAGGKRASGLDPVEERPDMGAEGIMNAWLEGIEE